MPITVLDRCARCPFYAKDTERAIYCEGMDMEQHVTVVGFRSAEAKRLWGQRYCKDRRWDEKCPYAANLMDRKYPQAKREKEPDNDES